MSDKKDYFDYVANVLGVKSILLNQESSSVLPVVPLLICVENLTDYSEAEKDLLAKMIGALKIDLQSIKVVELSESTLFQPHFSIYFIDDLKLKSEAKGPCVVQTYSPRFLLKNPDFKKNAWADLQKVILYFNREV